MTNFEKMKPGLDILFDDITAEELAELFYNGGIGCEYCKIQDKCSELMGIKGLADDEWPPEDGPTCYDVVMLYLQDESDENWIPKNPW